MIDKKDLKYSFDQMLQADTIIRRQRKNEQNIKKNLFLSVIKKYDDALTKSVMLETDFQIDLSKHEEPFYNIIDDLILLSWGEDIYKLIAFYFYDRIDIETGEENFIVDEAGNEFFIRTPEDLFLLINKLYPNII